MEVPFVDLKQQYFSLKSEIDDAISEVITNSDFIRGKHMEPFERAFADLIGVKHTVSCANGTDAIYIALKALGLRPDDEVITTAHTWISSSETITQAGGQVVFADTEKDTFNVDVSDVAAKITSKTVGIIAVHLCGQPCRIEELRDIATEKGLWLIEDCAQAHLASVNGRTVGSFGDIATFSFYPGKNLGAMGDAGAIVTNNDSMADWMRLYARHGGKGEHLIEGINSRLDGIQAAILRVKLPHLKNWTALRRSAAKIYNELLEDVDGVICPKEMGGTEHVYHLYMIMVESRDLVREELQKAGIGTSVNYSKALPFYEAYSYLGHAPSDFPNAFFNQSRILSLPIYPEITFEQQTYVVQTLKQILRRE